MGSFYPTVVNRPSSIREASRRDVHPPPPIWYNPWRLINIMVNKEIFDTLILLGRPASGKSEIIDYLSNTPEALRQKRFHIGQMEVIDDFPILWSWFEEDDLLRTQLGQPPLYTDEGGYFLHEYFWHLLIERIGLEYQKSKRNGSSALSNVTRIVEFSRGSEHGGYAAALPHLPDELLERAAICYVRVSYAESTRKNHRRFNPERPDSILEHALSDEKMERLYREDDWDDLTQGMDGSITVKSISVPYYVFENEDDVTSARSGQLGGRLEHTLSQLWEAQAHDQGG
jgi:hypothetical protein